MMRTSVDSGSWGSRLLGLTSLQLARLTTVAADFKQLVIDYIERRFGQGGAGRAAAE